MPWHDSWLSLDVETTGFGHSARILDMAVVRFEKGAVTNVWSSTFCPKDVDWNEEKVKEALAVNQLTQEGILGSPGFEEIHEEIAVILDPALPWVAHNMDFDLRVLMKEWARCFISMPPTPSLLICTMKLFQRMRGAKRKLGELAAYYGVILDQCHTARADAEACGQILSAMLRRGEVPTSDVAMRSLCLPRSSL